MSKERVIFPDGETKRITEDEFAAMEEPHYCEKQLFELMDAWRSTAEKILIESGYHVENGTGKRWYNYSPDEIDNPKAKAARHVAEKAKQLREAIFKTPTNKFLIALAGIHLASAAAQAHTIDFEQPAKLGISRQNQQHEFGEKRGTGLHNERKKEWLRWNNEARRLLKERPALSNSGRKSDLARKVKENLNLTEEIRTITRRLTR